MNDERVSFPRWWITRARDQLMAMDMPSGPLGDWVFLFREQLNDALNRPDDTTVAATPASKIRHKGIFIERQLQDGGAHLFICHTGITKFLPDLYPTQAQAIAAVDAALASPHSRPHGGQD